jgi:hypothetical protein
MFTIHLELPYRLFVSQMGCSIEVMVRLDKTGDRVAQDEL